MKYKIIKIQGCKTCNEVLLFLDINEDGEHYVHLIAWHENKEKDTFIQESFIFLEETPSEEKLLQRIIADFSKESALEFAKSMQF